VLGAELTGTLRAPLSEGLLSGPLDNLDKVRLTGTRCAACGEVSLGQRALCPNCGRDSIETIALAERGTLWSFTVIRHRPPGDYAGKEPFEPFGLGLIELADGLRVLSPIECDITSLKIGMDLKFKAYARPAPTGERVLFTFTPAV
jgi:uncharacterized OB-fold protein